MIQKISKAKVRKKVAKLRELFDELLPELDTACEQGRLNQDGENTHHHLTEARRHVGEAFSFYLDDEGSKVLGTIEVT